MLANPAQGELFFSLRQPRTGELFVMSQDMVSTEENRTVGRLHRIPEDQLYRLAPQHSARIGMGTHYHNIGLWSDTMIENVGRWAKAGSTAISTEVPTDGSRRRVHGGDRKGTSGEEEQHLEGTDDHNHQPILENDERYTPRAAGGTSSASPRGSEEEDAPAKEHKKERIIHLYIEDDEERDRSEYGSEYYIEGCGLFLNIL